MIDHIIRYALAWLIVAIQFICLEVCIRLIEGQWGSENRLAFCLALIALFETVRIRQKQ